MRRFRQVTGDDRDRAAEDVALWGYPRPFEAHEVEESAFFRYGPDCVFWLSPVDVLESTACLHIIAAPQTRGHHLVGARRLFQGIDIIADFLFLRRLIASDCEEGGRVASYLRRLGWREVQIPELQDDGMPWFEKTWPPFGET